MGACMANINSEDVGKSRNIDRSLREDFDQVPHKILLLGPGESGKSTFLKQLIELYAEQKNSQHPADFEFVIYGNIIHSTQMLIKKAREFEEKFDSTYKIPQTTAMIEAIRHIETLKGEEDNETSCIDASTAQLMLDLWNEPAIQLTYEKRATFQLHDSAKYFYDKIRQIGRDNYVPTVDDIIRSRLRTLGVNEVSFSVGDANFAVVDVGGQRSERNKWIHCFEDCSLLIFFASASEYDQYLYEDETTNRMDEALSLFEQISTSRWFKGTKVILFLNKIDLLKEKISHTPLSSCFPECQSTDIDSTCRFLEDKFRSVTSKKITTHFTCVTDGSSIEQLFQDIMTVLLREQLKNKNLL